MIGSKTGVVSVTIPTDAKEILLISTGTSSQNLTLHIPITFLTSTAQSFTMSYYLTASDNVFIKYSITRTTITFSKTYTNGGTDVTTATRWSAYYR